MKKINFTNATVTAQASVEIDGVSHDVTSAVIEGGTLPTPDNINQLQNNVEEAILNPVVESIKSKNLLDENGAIILGSVGFPVYLEAGKTYTISSNLPIYWFKISNNRDGENGGEWLAADGYTEYTFICTKSYPYAFIGIDKDNPYNLPSNVEAYANYKFQIEEGTVATKHSNYKGIGYTSGQNENGHWVKYDDGRMECFGELLYENVAIINADYGTYYAQLEPKPFAMSFKSNPICVMQVDSVAPAYALWLRSTDTGASATKTNKLLVTSMASCTANKIKIHYHAIGRWK